VRIIPEHRPQADFFRLVPVVRRHADCVLYLNCSLPRIWEDDPFGTLFRQQKKAPLGAGLFLLS
jgi:hypothetical protein